MWRNIQVQTYARFINAKANILSVQSDIDLRPLNEQEKPLVREVEENTRDADWDKIKELESTIRNAEKSAEECPNYQGLLK